VNGRPSAATAVISAAARVEPAVLPFRALFHAHVDFVWRVLRRLGVPDAEADDAVQEVFMVVARQLVGYQERGTVRAWLFTIARRVAQHSRRSRIRRERTQQSSPASSGSDDPHRLAERSQAVTLLREFLATLDENQAMVFYLAEVEGLSIPDIASSMQSNLNTAYGRLRLARKRFEAFVASHSGPGDAP
jgi:RNA polymerase sigma-70 factor (ECF subfamily)